MCQHHSLNKFSRHQFLTKSKMINRSQSFKISWVLSCIAANNRLPLSPWTSQNKIKASAVRLRAFRAMKRLRVLAKCLKMRISKDIRKFMTRICKWNNLLEVNWIYLGNLRFRSVTRMILSLCAKSMRRKMTRTIRTMSKVNIHFILNFEYFSSKTSWEERYISLRDGVWQS